MHLVQHIIMDVINYEINCLLQVEWFGYGVCFFPVDTKLSSLPSFPAPTNFLEYLQGQ